MSELSTREKLLHAALDLFSQKGYDATGVDEIAESIGMSGPIIYKYFKGKEDLLNSIHTISDNPYNEQMGFNTPFPIWIHNGEELKQFTMHQIHFTINNETIIKLRKLCTIEQFRNKDLTFEATNHQFDKIVNQYTDIFKGMIEHGAVEEMDPKVLSLEFTGPTAMLIQLSDREPSRRQEAIDMIEKHVDFFIKTHCKN